MFIVYVCPFKFQLVIFVKKIIYILRYHLIYRVLPVGKITQVIINYKKWYKLIIIAFIHNSNNISYLRHIQYIDNVNVVPRIKI